GAGQGERVVHEDVGALLDGVSEVGPAERRRGGEDHQVALPQAVDGLLVAVEADELVVFGHLHLFGEAFGQGVVRGAEPLGEHVGHGDQPGRAGRGGEHIEDGAGAAAAAADQGDADGVVLGGEDAGGQGRGGEGAGGQGRGGREAGGGRGDVGGGGAGGCRVVPRRFPPSG